MKNLILTKLTIFVTLSIMILLSSRCSDELPPRDKFLGTYSVVETCGSGTYNYNINILPSGSSENAVVVQNIYNYGESASAMVDGNNISISSQFLDGLTYSGNGTFSGNTLTLNFTVSNANGSDNCNAICTRK